ncbi:hypothetical protein V496_04603 [Pseudogymnoascus sp. VKM F-4515 (FW-2607)]|nr:hypothetical protein V496_04603 [Pseudogymnoascus sp. VKM F-4515 (FW-2607)]KFY96551.1 hypothetical protein V498_02607 [Pseudogymnoascus sp. VKM F-4517 (FW-2822)]
MLVEALKEVALVYNDNAKEGDPYFSKAKKSYASKGKDFANNPTTKDITNPTAKDIVASIKVEPTNLIARPAYATFATSAIPATRPALLYYAKVLAKLAKAKTNGIKAATLAFSTVVGVALNTY